MSVLSCLCRKVSLFFHAHKRKKCILIWCFLCSIEVPVPLIRKVSVFEQKCAFIPIDTLGNTFPDRWLQVNFNFKSTWSPTFAISRNTWAAMGCGRDSFYSWFPTGENQFVPGDSIDTQVVPWKADCEPRFWAMSVCLGLHLWSFPSCLGRSCREEKPFGDLSCVLSVAASSAATSMPGGGWQHKAALEMESSAPSCCHSPAELRGTVSHCSSTPACSAAAAAQPRLFCVLN